LIFVGLIEGNKEVIADNGFCISPFTDISYDHWAIDYIRAIKDAGITKGCNPFQNDRFCPEETRVQMEHLS